MYKYFRIISILITEIQIPVKQLIENDNAMYYFNAYYNEGFLCIMFIVHLYSGYNCLKSKNLKKKVRHIQQCFGRTIFFKKLFPDNIYSERFEISNWPRGCCVRNLWYNKHKSFLYFISLASRFARASGS